MQKVQHLPTVGSANSRSLSGVLVEPTSSASAVPSSKTSSRQHGGDVLPVLPMGSAKSTTCCTEASQVTNAEVIQHPPVQARRQSDALSPNIARRSLSDKPMELHLGSSSSATPKGTGLTLAARRNFKGTADTKAPQLSISTKKESKSKERRKIRVVEKFTELFTVGKEVMPSSHNGMSIIFATRKSDKEEVVVKVRARASSFCDKGEEREWRASMEFMLNLPPTEGLAKLYEVLEDSKGYYVIMEKVPGQDLFETVTGKGLLPVGEVKEVLRQLLKALQELHSRNCIHKDLKLENIMFDRSPSWNAKTSYEEEEMHSPVQVKLIDFDTLESVTPATPKRAKDVLGTDQYISQEAYDGHYSAASDIFAAGVIGYRLLTSRFPFRSDMFNDEAGENWVGSPKMKEIRQKLCNYKIDWNQRVFSVEPHAKDLLKAMLANSETQRPSAEEALQHPFLVAPQRRRSLPNLDVSAIASMRAHAQTPVAGVSETCASAVESAGSIDLRRSVA
jgi:serine/threonine protein kinase